MAETQIYYLEDESGNIFYVGATKQKDLRNNRKNLSQKAIQQWEDGRGHHPKQTKGGM